MTEEKETTFKTNSSAPIPAPISEPIHEEPVEEPPILDIPEYDTHDFEELTPQETPLSDEDKLERRQILRKLFRYRQMFPSEVSNLPITDAIDLSLDQLRSLVDDTEYLVACRKSMKSSRAMFLSSVNVAEMMSKPTPLMLNGISNVCANNEDLLSVVDELSIKYESNLMVSPEKRLMLIMAQIAIQVHQINKTVANKDEIKPTEEQEKRDKRIDDLTEGL